MLSGFLSSVLICLVAALLLKKSLVKRYLIRFPAPGDLIYGTYIPFVTPQPPVKAEPTGVLYKEAPGPFKYPVIGSLHLLGQDKYPFEALTKLKEVSYVLNFLKTVGLLV